MVDDLLEVNEILDYFVDDVEFFCQPVNNDLDIFEILSSSGPEEIRYMLQLHKIAGVR